MSEVFFEIMSPRPLNREQDAIELFRLWFDNAPGFFPDRAGGYEPLRQKLSIETVGDILKDWSVQFFTKRVASPKVQSAVLMQYGPHRKHAIWKIAVQEHAKFDQDAFETLMRRGVDKFAADFGLIHIPTTVDAERSKQDGTVVFLDPRKKNKNLMVTTFTLRKYLPNLYWMTVFGAPYVRLFSRERLLATPAHKVIELSGGAILVQLTPNILDCISGVDSFEKKRAIAREFLGCDAFLDPKLPQTHAYNVPEFEWHPILN